MASLGWPAFTMAPNFRRAAVRAAREHVRVAEALRPQDPQAPVARRGDSHRRAAGAADTPDSRRVSGADSPDADLVRSRVCDVEAADRRAASGVRPSMPICMPLVPGIVRRGADGTAVRVDVLRQHTEVAARVRVPGHDGPATRVRGEVRVIAVLPERRLVVVVGSSRREARVDPRAERAGEGLQRRAVGADGRRQVAPVRLRADRDRPSRAGAPSSRRRPARGRCSSPGGGRSSPCVRKPPQKARSPPGSTHERRVGEADPAALDRGGRSDACRRAR